MRFLVLAAALGLASTPVALAAQAEGQVKYQRWGMFGGYKEKVLGPNSWRVLAGVNGVAPEGSAAHIALYRAAELAAQAGFSHFQVVDQKGSQTYFGIGGGAANNRGGGSAELRIVAVNDAAPPTDCLAESRDLCMTLSVEGAMIAALPYLKFPKPKAK